ncbi:MAG: hypothetical protein A2958_01205 [Candidatus Levybacteria bacterium RIFCSPLOWO2_01_FULL_38_13]|nr:MAG: hypothetical protein A2629_01065 [Candidatus Levybacteria bacterium RIFCSPHIGHO2_01_FULL_41_15]OGH35772.1 MAG: hypothetical protein A2958_01205 [Candidatus Levybacteria bacterium RIFCSPLOWO2_01_FULL_38_13]
MSKFPNIFRSIAENNFFLKVKKNQRAILIGFVSTLIFGAVLVVAVDSYRNYKENQKISRERAKIENEITFWESSLINYPNYRDAYFKLALLNHQLKNFDKAEKYLEKTLQIDPNFREGRKLEKILYRY